jgi:hypothetical protein
MLLLRKLALLFLFLPTIVSGQGYVLQNFSNGTPGTVVTPTSLANGAQGTQDLSGTGWTTNMPGNSMAYVNTGICGGTSPPANAGGSVAMQQDTNLATNKLDYISYWPPSNTYYNAITTAWFCHDLQPTDNIGASWDSYGIYGSGNNGGESFLNVILAGNNSTGNGIGLGVEGPGGTCPGWLIVQRLTWYQMSVHWHSAGTADAKFFDANGNLLMSCSESANNGAISYVWMGDINHIDKPANRHVWWMNWKVSYIGTTDAQFPMLENPVPLWDGVLTPGRAINWSQMGIPLGLPDDSWQQCGTTLPAGTYTGASITANIAGCPSNSFYRLGPGQFNVSGTIRHTLNNVVIRGSGPKTVLKFSSGQSQCGQIAAGVCLTSTDTTNISSAPAQISWTAAAQGANQITVSSSSGISVGAVIVLNQYDTGCTSPSCTGGSALDNGNLYICAIGNCSIDGGGGGPLAARNILEYHVVTSVNGNVLGVYPSVVMPSWSAGQSPQLWHFTPLTHAGVENLVIDMQGNNPCLEFQNTYQSWVSGVTCLNAHFASMNFFEAVNSLVRNSYLFNNNLTGPNSGYGFRPSYSGNNVFENNICQQVGQCFFEDGPGVAEVYLYNFCANGLYSGNDFLGNAFDNHNLNFYDLYEGNVCNEIQADNTHGTQMMMTRHRNLLPGWENYPSAPKTSNTWAISDYPYARYMNNVANLLGTVGYHTTYSGSESCSTCVYMVDNSDALVGSTALRWGNYDIVNATNRFQSGEIPTTAPVYPNFSPVFGNTSAGQQKLPASFYYSSKPWYFKASTPWPLLGPEVAAGNVGYCSGTISPPAQNAGMPSISNAGCSPGTLQTGWGGHANANPAMDCALRVMGMPVDGSGNALIFNPAACFEASSSPLWSNQLLPTYGTNACPFGDIAAADLCAIDWAGLQVGVPGGIPSGSWTQSGAMITASGDVTTTVQTALNGCGTNHYVLIGPGTATFSSQVKVPSNCELRGSGPRQTILQSTTSVAPISLGSEADNPWQNANATILSGSTAGSTTMTITDSTTTSGGSAGYNLSALGFAGTCSSAATCNDYFVISELNNLVYVDPSGPQQCTSNDPPTCSAQTWTPCTYCDNSMWSGTRDRGQIIEVTSVVQSGANWILTFNPPLFTDYGVASGTGPAYATPFAVGTAHPSAKWAGVRNLQIYAQGYAFSGGHPNFNLNQCAYCWLDNVIGNYADGDHVDTNFCFHCEIRDSYFFNSYGHGSGGTDADLQTGGKTTLSLIENNILERLHASALTDWGSAGNVIAYNYCVGNVDANGFGLVQMTLGEHGPFPQFNLYEGNVCPYYNPDSWHGNEGYMTNFRNWWLGGDQLTPYASYAISSISCGSGTCTITWVSSAMPMYAGDLVLIYGTSIPACGSGNGLGAQGAESYNVTGQNTFSGSSCNGATGGYATTHDVSHASVPKPHPALDFSHTYFPYQGTYGTTIAAYSVQMNLLGNVYGSTAQSTADSNNLYNSGGNGCSICLQSPTNRPYLGLGGAVTFDYDTIGTSNGQPYWSVYKAGPSSVAGYWSTQGFTTACVSGEYAYGSTVNTVNCPAISTSLPASYYKASTPTWWKDGIGGSLIPFPAIGFDVTGGQDSAVGGHAYQIPAQVCYNKLGRDGTGMKLFDANVCYYALGTPPTAPTGVTIQIQ